MTDSDHEECVFDPIITQLILTQIIGSFSCSTLKIVFLTFTKPTKVSVYAGLQNHMMETL